MEFHKKFPKNQLTGLFWTKSSIKYIIPFLVLTTFLDSFKVMPTSTWDLS